MNFWFSLENAIPKMYNYHMSKYKVGIVLATSFSVVNLLLALTKLYIGISTNMLSVLTDSYNSFYDCLLGLAVLVALVLAHKEPSKKYPNGYGRIEYIVGFAAAIGIGALGASLAYKAVTRLVYPSPTQYVQLYAYILIICAVVKLALGLTIFKLNGKRSLSVHMLALDSFVDVAVAVTTLISYLLQANSSFRLDAVFGLIASGFVIFEGIKTMLDTGGKLTGKVANADLIVNTVLAVSGVNSAKCIETLDYGEVKKAVLVIQTEFDDNSDQSEKIKQEITAKIQEYGYNQVIIDIRRTI